MRNDLAALTPPLVMAVAFIAGVVALLRREMAPRRRGGMTQPEETDWPRDPHGEMTSPEYSQMPGGRQNGDGDGTSGDNSANNDAVGSAMRDLPDREDDGVISPASEDQPPASPRA